MTPASDTTHKALSRRIKQHVIGRPQDFYTITLPGLETLCRGELAALEDPPADLRVSKGGVAFQGRLTSCYQANLMCRTASRFLMRIQQCKARHFDELEERVRAVPWELYLKIDVSLEVRASIRRSKLYHSQAVSERILKAVSARLALHGRKDAGTEREGPVQCIWAHLQEDRLTLSLDSSGAPLHKRGIKTTGGPAPLRETLAAGALMQAGFDSQTVLCDPMCGSGTLAIEAALLATNTAPGLFRDNFGFMHLRSFDRAVWIKMVEDARAQTRPCEADIFASDLSADAVSIAKINARAAGMDQNIRFETVDFRKISIPPEPGIVIVNPEYGERLGEEEALKVTYAEIGDLFKKQCKGYTGYIFTGNRELAKVVGLRTRRKVPFYNGKIECRLLEYELYEGSKKK